MTELETILSIVIILSALLNVGVFMYARSAISRLLYVSNHTESVYQMEMFYGDQTLEDLMNHAQSFNEQLETFEFIYSLTEAENINEDIEQIGIEEAEPS